MANRFRQFRLLLWKNFILQVSMRVFLAALLWSSCNLESKMAVELDHNFCICFWFRKYCVNIVCLFFPSKIRRPIGTVFELLVPVLLLSVLILPKWVVFFALGLQKGFLTLPPWRKTERSKLRGPASDRTRLSKLFIDQFCPHFD